MSAFAAQDEATTRQPDETRAHIRLSEIVASALLAFAGVATSWSSYQATLWSGAQAKHYSEANALRLTATREFTMAGQFALIDVTAFESWANAYTTGNEELQGFYRARFRPEFRSAFEAWLAKDPMHNSRAPVTPFVMPEYRLAHEEAALKLEQLAAASSRAGNSANSNSDRFVRGAVLFATVMFFAGISQQFRLIRLKVALLGFALVLLTYGTIIIVSYPRA